MPLVSICILAFNHEDYISSAITSVLEQDYNNLEIIVVDNGSSDDTVRIIRDEFKCQIAKGMIRFFPLKDNTYPSHGTNFGLRQANGKFVCLLSGDDTYHQNKISRQVEIMLAKGLTNLFTWVNIIDDDNNILVSDQLEYVFNKEYDSQDIKEHFLRSGNMLCALSAMFDTNIFKTHGFFDERLVQLQDYDFWLRLITHEPINLIKEKLTNYRKRGDEGNLSLTDSSDRIRRTEFEELYVNRHLLNFDCQTIERVVGKPVSESCKSLALYQYYLSKGSYNKAKCFLLMSFERFGPSIDFPSKEYRKFFELYSKCDFFESNSDIYMMEEIERLKVKVFEYENSRVLHYLSVCLRLCRKLVGKVL